MGVLCHCRCGAAALLAMGPHMTVRGAIVAPGPYAWLMRLCARLRRPARAGSLCDAGDAVSGGACRAWRVGTPESRKALRRRRWSFSQALSSSVESWPREFEINVAHRRRGSGPHTASNSTLAGAFRRFTRRFATRTRRPFCSSSRLAARLGSSRRVLRGLPPSAPGQRLFGLLSREPSRVGARCSICA